ncbi:hypothetical protein Sango_1595200 [Sesamum angolense]|uniref:Uncharacterized protein n=1 Tax=Sesamum angolense TaxID=2727404 RepID=A0AAE1WQ81_9LAMI|nr:hypothetical protein Sango_1595200 [Sesamum angolense]
MRWWKTMRHYVSASQQNWVDLLDAAQLSYNLHKSSTTDMSPSELAYGRQPTTPHEISIQKSGRKCPAAYQFARSKQELLDKAKDSLAKAQRNADMGRRHVEFSVGDQVLLKLTPQIWKMISSKSVYRGVIPKYDGPFEDLLDTTRQQTQRALPVIQKEFEKTVLKILNHRTMGQSVGWLLAWCNTVMDSQADGRSGCQVVACAGRHAAHVMWADLADTHPELGSEARHSTAMRWSSAAVHKAC